VEKDGGNEEVTPEPVGEIPQDEPEATEEPESSSETGEDSEE
jgi:hypothetical protein